MPPALNRLLASYKGYISFLDFDTLQEYATKVFESYINRQQQRAVVLVIDLLDKLIEGIAEEQIALHEIHWLEM